MNNNLGAIGTGSRTATSAALLFSIPDINLPDGASVYVVDQTSSNSGTYWRLDKKSSATTGPTAISTKSGVGRWLLFQTTQQTGTIASPNDTYIWTIRPVDTSKAPFVAYLHAQNFNGTIDNVWFMGYNADNGNTSEPVARYGMEQDYNDGSGSDKLEVYIELYTAGLQNQCRPWMIQQDRVKGTTGNNFYWRNASDSSASGFWGFANYATGNSPVMRVLDSGLEMFQPILGGAANSPGPIQMSSFNGSNVLPTEKFVPVTTAPGFGSAVATARSVIYLQTVNAAVGQAFVTNDTGGNLVVPNGRTVSVRFHWTAVDTSNGHVIAGETIGVFRASAGAATMAGATQLGGSPVGDAALSTCVCAPFASGANAAVGVTPPAAYSGTLQWAISTEIVMLGT